jgi:hypothetical protein
VLTGSGVIGSGFVDIGVCGRRGVGVVLPEASLNSPSYDSSPGGREENLDAVGGDIADIRRGLM